MIRFHLLLIEDDNKIRKLLEQFLQQQKFLVTAVPNLAEALKALGYFQFDLIILDITLPDGTGFDFIDEMPENAPPVIILSALGHVDDRIYGLEKGARDYITKPFDPRELALRINKLLGSSVRENVKFGEFEFNIEKRELLSGGQLVHLTSSEKQMLKVFCQHVKRIFTREELADEIGETFNDRTIDNMIARLRGKIEADPKNPKFIITERQKGYSFWN